MVLPSIKLINKLLINIMEKPIVQYLNANSKLPFMSFLNFLKSSIIVFLYIINSIIINNNSDNAKYSVYVLSLILLGLIPRILNNIYEDNNNSNIIVILFSIISILFIILFFILSYPLILYQYFIN